MRKYLLIAAMLGTVATPALAEEIGVGVRAGPVGVGVGTGVTVGQSREYRDRTTVIREREPRETSRTTVIKKHNEDGTREKTIIHHDND